MNETVTHHKNGKNGGEATTLTVSAKLLDAEQGGDETPVVEAYAFGAGGRLLDRKKLDARGHATLEISAGKEGQHVKVLVGPSPDEKLPTTDPPTIASLLRLGAKKKLVHVGHANPSAVEFTIIRNDWICWILSICSVPGKVVKRVVSGGIAMDLPVCNATVEVYEVDPIWILLPKLPDSVIEKLREIVLRPIPPFPPEPGPDPAPFFETTTPKEELPAMREAEFTRHHAAVAPKTLARSVQFPADLQFLARTTNTDQFRLSLVNHAEIIRPILCWIRPFPFVVKQLVATVQTDDCGEFHAFFFRGCHGEQKPDLYFIVKQQVFPLPWFPKTIIYAPTPVHCYTRWDYTCGTEVTIRVTHPLARTCPPCPSVNAPNNWVLFMAIGNTPLSRINGASVPLAATTSDANRGLVDATSPFGGLLRPRLEFDNSLRSDLGVRYYRVSYRQGTSGAFIPLTGVVNRHYTHEVGGDLILEAYNLGPQTVGTTASLYEIPPALPPIGQWSLPDVVEDTASAKFATTSLAQLEAPGVSWTAQGKYQLKVDLFDAAGNIVNVDTLGIKYRVPAVTDLSGDIDTEDAADATLTNGLGSPGSGLVRDEDGDGLKSMIVTVHLDNSRTNAAIPAPSLNGTFASDECGVLRYDPATPGSVTMRYRGEHPHGLGVEGYANYSFTLYRGANALTLPPAPATPTLPASGRTPLPPVTVTDVQSVTDLLGSCDVAGFSENLYVAALATDGWRRLSEYDSSAVRAFVLAKQETPPNP